MTVVRGLGAKRNELIVKVVERHKRKMGVENKFNAHFSERSLYSRLVLVVHFKFDRGGCQTEAFHFLSLQFNVGFDHVFGEDAAAG